MESFRHDAGFRDDANIHFFEMTGFSAPGGGPLMARLLALEGAQLLAAWEGYFKKRPFPSQQTA